MITMCLILWMPTAAAGACIGCDPLAVVTVTATASKASASIVTARCERTIPIGDDRMRPGPTPQVLRHRCVTAVGGTREVPHKTKKSGGGQDGEQHALGKVEHHQQAASDPNLGGGGRRHAGCNGRQRR